MVVVGVQSSSSGKSSSGLLRIGAAAELAWSGEFHSTGKIGEHVTQTVALAPLLLADPGYRILR